MVEYFTSWIGGVSFPGLLPVLAPVIGMAVSLCVHLLLSVSGSMRSQMNCLLAGFLSGLGIVAVLTFFSLSRAPLNVPDFSSYFLLNLAIYAASSYCYFHFVNIQIASLRMQMMREIAKSKGGMSKQEILQRYNASRILNTRIQRLTDGGYLKESNGRFYPGDRSFFLVLFHIFELMKRMIIGRGHRLPDPCPMSSKK